MAFNHLLDDLINSYIHIHLIYSMYLIYKYVYYFLLILYVYKRLKLFYLNFYKN